MTHKIVLKYITVFLVFIYAITLNAQKALNSPKDAENLSESKLYEYNYALTEATKLMLFGEYKQAIALYNKCIEVNPQSSAAYYELSMIYAKSGDIKTAKIYAQQALAIDKSNVWYNYQLANIYSYTNNIDSSIAIYEDIVKDYPEKIENAIYLASLYYKNKQIGACNNLLLELKNSVGISEQINLSLYETSIYSKDYDLAETQINELLSLDPENAKYYGILAELFAAKGSDSMALEMYDEMIKYDPDNSIGLFSLADFYRDRGKYMESFIYYKKAYENDQFGLEEKLGSMVQLIGTIDTLKEYKEDVLGLIDILNNKYPSNVKVKTITIDYLLRVEDYVTALSELKELLAINDEEYFFWEKLILIENYLGLYTDVIKDGVIALNNFKDKPLFYLYISIACIQLEEYNKAIDFLNRGLVYAREAEEKVQFFSFLGDAYNKLGDYRKSDISFEEALKLDPKNILILNNYSYYLAVRGEKLEYALKNSKYTIKEDPTNASYLDTYAWILFKLGKYKQAKEYMILVIKYATETNSEMYEHFGDILSKLGEKQEALKMYQLALGLTDNKDPIVEKMNLLGN